MGNKIEVSYVTTLPKEGNAPRISIIGTDIQTYSIEITNEESGIEYGEYECNTNEVLIPRLPQWYIPWKIKIRSNDGLLVSIDSLKNGLKNSVVFIKVDAWALGDTIAWIPYIEAFRVKHGCKVICSTFHNFLFTKAYPKIMFLVPNIQIDNVYAQYYIGATNEDNKYYSPIKVNQNPLQKVASEILGLDYIEMRPDLGSQISHIKPRVEGKYVCLSEYGSDVRKHWVAENGWQMVVDKLNEIGYKVLVISKEPTTLTGVVDLTGNINLIERMIDLRYAEFFIGVSSGLSWLSWAVGTHTVMISDVTPNWHEFQTDITRINCNDLDEVNYSVETKTDSEKVVKIIEELGVSRYL